MPTEFGMKTCKPIKTHFQVVIHFSIQMCPNNHEEKDYTVTLAYTRDVGYPMHAMDAHTRIKITFSMGLVTKFIIEA